MKYACYLFFLFALVAPATAHELGQSYVYLRIFDDAIEVRVEITSDDLRSVLNVDWPEKRVSREMVDSDIDAVLAYIRPRLYVGTGERELALRYVDADIRRLKPADFVLLNFVIDDIAGLRDRLEVELSALFEVDVRRRNMMIIEHHWKTTTFNNEGNVSLIFSPSDPRQVLDLDRSSVLRGFLGFVRLGGWHILIGLDHILFLVALALPSVLYREEKKWIPVKNFRGALLNIIAIVTCFTIAHSITLSLAALEVVNLPSRLVESVIAASIVAAALHNLYPRFHGREWAFAFVFGLFHGFGFATVLSELGLESKYVVVSLLGFNAGVEVGQIVIIAIIFPALFLLRANGWYPRAVLRIGSLLLAAVALVWLAERTLDVPLYQFAFRMPRYLYHLLV